MGGFDGSQSQRGNHVHGGCAGARHLSGTCSDASASDASATAVIESNLFLKAARKPVTGGLLWRLPIDTLLMLGLGFAGEDGSFD